jgi:hypothetical protein
VSRKRLCEKVVPDPEFGGEPETVCVWKMVPGTEFSWRGEKGCVEKWCLAPNLAVSRKGVCEKAVPGTEFGGEAKTGV